jgi:pimeloyl-ACP methyl ester carboxylesterase
MGDGHPVVLIHAGVADRRMWDDQVDALARVHKVIRYDLRGYGQSKATDLDSADREDLFELLRFLSVDRTSLCGVSAGGHAAIDFTLEHPDMVDALIAVACAPSGFRRTHKRPDAEEVLFAESDAAWQRGDVERLVALAVQAWVDGPGQPPNRVPAPARDRVRQMIVTNFDALRQRRRPPVNPLNPPATTRLAEIRAPTLVIVGDLDTSAVRAGADLLSEGIASARKIVMAGCAHMLNMERPDEFSEIVLKFLAHLEEGSVS